MVQCTTSSKRMLSATNTKYIIMNVSPRSFPSFHRNKAMLTIMTISMPTSSSTEQKSPLLKTDTGCPPFTALNSSHGIGSLCIAEEQNNMGQYRKLSLSPNVPTVFL